MKKLFLPAAILIGLTSACTGTTTSINDAMYEPADIKTPAKSIKAVATATGQTQTKSATKTKGLVRAISNKSKIITLQQGIGPKAKNIMIKFDTDTIGLEHVVEDQVVIIQLAVRNGKQVATRITQNVAKVPPGTTHWPVSRLHKLIENKASGYTLIDARPEFAFNRGHIPGAINIPTNKMKSSKARLPVAKNSLLIFYCGGISCDLSSKSAKMAQNMGYEHIFVTLGGEPEWTASGYTLESPVEHVLHGNMLLLDLRKNATDNHYIPGAVGIAIDDLADAVEFEDIPVKAEVALYGDNLDDIEAAIKILHDNGVQHVSMVAGNYDGWKAAGNELVEGVPTDEIDWVRKLGEGEVTAETFLAAAADDNDHITIVDVRNPEVRSAGFIRSSINIPLDEITERLNELNKNETVYVYCETGARAQQGYDALKTAKYNVNYVIGQLVCENDSCTVN